MLSVIVFVLSYYFLLRTSPIPNCPQTPQETDPTTTLCTCLGLTVVALPLSVGAQCEAQLMCVVGEGLARCVGAVVGGAAVLALVRRTGVGHLHLVAPLGQRLVGFAVHLLHGLQGVRRDGGASAEEGGGGLGALLGPASDAQHKHSTATTQSTESER